MRPETRKDGDNKALGRGKDELAGAGTTDPTTGSEAHDGTEAGGPRRCTAGGDAADTLRAGERVPAGGGAGRPGRVLPRAPHVGPAGRSCRWRTRHWRTRGPG